MVFVRIKRKKISHNTSKISAKLNFVAECIERVVAKKFLKQENFDERQKVAL